MATYKTALTLPYIGGSAANPVVTKFAQVTMGQHAQHADAFNAAAKHLGGKAQNNPDPAFVPVVNKAVASLNGATAAQGALGVVGLALELENIAAETYVNDTTLAKSATNKALFASIMGIEAQHVSVLLAVQALLMAGAPQLISLSPGTAAALPAAAGSVGFPNRVLQDQHGRPGQARSRQVSKRRKDTFEGSETELLAMTTELDELHHDVGMPAMSEGVSNMIDSMGGGARSTSRRTFLLGAGAAAAGGAAMLVIGRDTRDGRRGDALAVVGRLRSGLRRSRRPASPVTWRSPRSRPAWRTWPSSPTTPASARPRPASSARCPPLSPRLRPRSRASTSNTLTRGTVCSSRTGRHRSR